MANAELVERLHQRFACVAMVWKLKGVLAFWVLADASCWLTTAEAAAAACAGFLVLMLLAGPKGKQGGLCGGFVVS